MRLGIATFQEKPSPTADDALMVAALSGVDVVAAPWDEDGGLWRTCDAVLVRSPWDYHMRVREFVSWAHGLEEAGVPVWNPATLMGWNVSKTYLRELADAGVQTVPTVWLEPGAVDNWPHLIRESGWQELVLKPTVGASSFLTFRTTQEEVAARPDRLARLAEQGGALAQPFVQEVLTEGEWSLIYFEGRYSHAVRKRARQGEFRVQVEFGGEEIPETPPVEVAAAGRKALETLPVEPLYARVDGIETEAGFVLTELELIEPVLFLASDPAAAERFAEAIVGRLRGLTGSPAS